MLAEYVVLASSTLAVRGCTFLGASRMRQICFFGADIRADGVSFKMEVVIPDNGGEFYGGNLHFCDRNYDTRFCKTQEVTTSMSPGSNSVAEQGLTVVNTISTCSDDLGADHLLARLTSGDEHAVRAEAMNALVLRCPESHRHRLQPEREIAARVMGIVVLLSLRVNLSFFQDFVAGTLPSRSFLRNESCFLPRAKGSNTRGTLCGCSSARYEVVEAREVTWEAPATEDVSPPPILCPSYRRWGRKGGGADGGLI